MVKETAKIEKLAQESKESTFRRVSKATPRSIPEIERLPLHEGLMALAGIIALILAVPSFFINMGVMSVFGAGLGGSFIVSLLLTFFCVVFGFLFLCCFVLDRRRPGLASGTAFVLSIFSIILGGFGGLIAGIMGMCGGAIGILKISRILPDSVVSGPPIIDEIFLMYRDGRLIRHYTRRLKPSIDQDILSSMLVAVQDFVKDSFARTTGEEHTGVMDEMKFGQYNIVIGRGKYIMIATLVLGEGADRLKSQISKAVADIEKKHDAVLKDWSGVIDVLRPLNSEMKGLINGEYEGKTRR
jgi:hypothetical protein